MGDDLRIRAEPTPNPHICRFVVNRKLIQGAAAFTADDAMGDTADDDTTNSPLATRLLALEGVNQVQVVNDTLTVTQSQRRPWAELGKEVGAAIRAQLATDEAPFAPPAEDDETLRTKIQVLLKRDINPNLGGHGGFATLEGVRDGKAYVRLGGGCAGCGMANLTLKHSIEGYLRKRLPQITEVIDVTDHNAGCSPYYPPQR